MSKDVNYQEIKILLINNDSYFKKNKNPPTI